MANPRQAPSRKEKEYPRIEERRKLGGIALNKSSSEEREPLRL